MARDRDRAFFGHPIGLMTLFFTEMFERFSYYGMRAFLGFYLTAPKDMGGVGMLDEVGGTVVGMFGAAVYLLSLPGGWIADRFLGQRKAVTIGGIGIALGNGLLAVPGEMAQQLLWPGLILIAMGTGFLKPNVSTIVGQLYSADDKRRDAGYTIYYMGINVGATLAPFVCGWLAGEGLKTETFRGWLAAHDIDPNTCWHWAFGAAALGMVGGLIQYTFGQRLLGEAGVKPTIPSDPKKAQRDKNVLIGIVVGLVVLAIVFVLVKPSQATSRDVMGIGLAVGSIILFIGLYKNARDGGERRRILAMIPLFLGAVGFFGIFEQSPTTLNFYARDLVEREFLGINIPAAFYQSVNGFFIVALAPVFAFLWIRLARAGKEPTSVNKFAIGMAILALSFVIMIPTFPNLMTKLVGMGQTPPSPERVSGGYLLGLYFFYTCAELCISPVGLSSMSKLAPQRLAGMVMGVWFLGTAVGIYLAGRATSISEANGYRFLFIFLIIASLVMAAALFVVAPIIKRMLSADDARASAVADRSEKAEPEPLPEARVVEGKPNTKDDVN
jgi:POT family proton-dependent oligopeptide transporter